MAANAFVPGLTAKKWVQDVVDSWTAVHAVLLTDAYTPNKDADEFWDDISANEVANGNGYTTGGKDITSTIVAAAYNTSTDTVMVDVNADIVWDDSTIDAQFVAFVDWTGTPSTSRIISIQDADEVKSSEDGDFKFVANAGGILSFPVGS